MYLRLQPLMLFQGEGGGGGGDKWIENALIKHSSFQWGDARECEVKRRKANIKFMSVACKGGDGALSTDEHTRSASSHSPGLDAFMWNSHFVACTNSCESESEKKTSTLSSKPLFGVPVCRGAE